MSEATGWQSWSGDLTDMPPEIRAQVAAEQQRVPLADVRINILDLAPGQSEIQVWVAPDGALQDANGHGAARRAAYEALRTCLERELATALHSLGNAA